MCKLSSLASSKALDEGVIASVKKLNTFARLANIMGALRTAKPLGLSIRRIGQLNIRDVTPYLLLGRVW
jgi:hypothetical protein